MKRQSVLIVGGGAAGSAAAVALRQLDQDVEVTVVGQEASAPYNRTTVNKGLLSGAVDETAITLPDMDVEGIRWRTGVRAVAFDADRRSLQLEDGITVTADSIILATGASPRRLSMPTDEAAANRIVHLRTKSDTLQLRGLLAQGRSKVLIVGAGLIGSETAGILTLAGHHVTLIDGRPLPLLSYVGQSVARGVAQAHERAGVDLRSNTRVTRVKTNGGTDLQVELSGKDLHVKDTVLADVVVVALGVEPDTAWLESSGVPLHAGGVLVDAHQRVSDHDGIYAAGDIAAVASPDGRIVRIEHWGAALAQGRTAAQTIVAAHHGSRPVGEGSTASAASAVPAYSTYVHGTKVTVVGDARQAATESAVLGAPGDPRFAFAFLDSEQRIVAGVGVGGARAVNQLKPLIERQAHHEELEASR
ncbi:NAD(P)/FAD-dependent oxidoreductase [uncultured Arthrobacter sp.]|uniref:NAD(P)/FAD-dependent oxidoreductase n=1 Tax=uncultured Arthrobacter sp. TaxID=114050 RepID=UPI0026211127|nr:FAD-dependent oxidoreductase [uncultured Arthrobacter sp.]